MKIKLDENLPKKLLSVFTELEHDCDTVVDEGLTGKEDDIIWNAAQDEGRFFITQDMDFADKRKFFQKKHHGILIIRLRDPGRTNLFKKILSIFKNEDTTKWKGRFVVATDHKIRVK